jgi:prepilin-type N-terminal cleavage/methylation domain-containing protein
MNRPMRMGRPGMTLLEMIVALLIFSFVMTATLALLKTESRSFALGSERVSMYQNGRFALNEMEKDMRTSGAGAPDIQPQMIYISDSVMMFNANYWTNTPGDVEAVYYSPDAPDSAVSAMRMTAKITIPYTVIQYPDTNYLSGGVNSAAETIIFYFMKDASTARTDDYALYRRVNNLPPEIVSTNILQTAGQPFFEYFRERNTVSGVKTLDTLVTGTLPLRHTRPIHLALNDIGAFALIDSIRAVRVSFTVTNGKTGADQRFRALSRLIRLPNVGLVNTKTCGDAPIFTATPVAHDTLAADEVTPVITVTFAPSVDETAGEEDVERYVIWRRLSTVLDWGDPLVTLPNGASPNVFTDAEIVSGLSYYYAVAAQDCTPSISGQRVSNLVTVP